MARSNGGSCALGKKAQDVSGAPTQPPDPLSFNGRTPGCYPGDVGSSPAGGASAARPGNPRGCGADRPRHLDVAQFGQRAPFGSGRPVVRIHPSRPRDGLTREGGEGVSQLAESLQGMQVLPAACLPSKQVEWVRDPRIPPTRVGRVVRTPPCQGGGRGFDPHTRDRGGCTRVAQGADRDPAHESSILSSHPKGV